MNKKNYLIISGGTGGHVIPAVNFGNFIIENGYDCFLLVDQRGRKYTKKFKGKIKIINSSNFSNSLLNKFNALILYSISFFQSCKYMINIMPSSCISFGSYATFMPLFVLVFLRFFGFTKIFIHEQNSVMGRVNNFFSPFADKIFLNFDQPYKLKKRYLKKSFLVGFPSNNKIYLKDRKINFKKKKYINLLVSGGSQGAVSLNNIIIDLIKKFPRNILDQINISIQCPIHQKEKINFFLKKLNIKYELNIFFDNFIEKLYESDVLITRSGAGTVNDVILTQIPTIFVPLPFSTDNHQFYNANFLKQKNAALLIEQKDLNSEQSLSILIGLISNFSKQTDLIKNLKEIKCFDSNHLILKHIN